MYVKFDDTLTGQSHELCEHELKLNEKNNIVFCVKCGDRWIEETDGDLCPPCPRPCPRPCPNNWWSTYPSDTTITYGTTT